MNQLAALAVAVPLLGAATLVIVRLVAGRRIIDLVAIGFSLITLAVTVSLLLEASDVHLVYWFGDWLPSEGIALGIAFVVQPIGAALAVLAAALASVCFIFSWRYFDAVGGLYHVLVMVFLAAMIGFSLSGDLFNLFVFFELMSVSAFALTGYKTEESETLQGAINFGVSNGIGAIMILIGLAFLYGRTGALNLAQMGNSLAESPLDGLVVASFVLIISGFLIKAAIVPFHFWLADAYAVAPAPVCVMFAGVLSELGLYGIALVYWTVFSGPLGPHAEVVRNVLVSMGAITAVIAALGCFAQRRLKRMIAFATMSHAGLVMIGIALLTPLGLGGAVAYVAGDALIKAALFLCVGILLHRYGSADVVHLYGRGRDALFLGGLMVLGALGFTGLPPFSTFIGKAMIDEAAVEEGLAWIVVVISFVSAITGAAVFRVAARVFLGWGPLPTSVGDASRDEEDEEAESAGGGRSPAVMVLPTILFLVAALGLGLVPGIEKVAERAGERFTDRDVYQRAVLAEPPVSNSERVEADPIGLPARPNPRPQGALVGTVATLLALLIAYAALSPRSFPATLRHLARDTTPFFEMMRKAHSGHVGDYVAWLSAGVAALGAIFVTALL